MLAGFTAGLLLITISELGDKTFFIAAILAMQHSQRWVFVGVSAALSCMTVLSVLLGQAAALLPKHYVQGTAVALFLGCGFKLLFEASRMTRQNGLANEQEAARAAVEHQQTRLRTCWSILAKAFTLTFLAEWGDRTQLATITLAAANHPVGVTAGATLGHAICAAIAVMSGRFLAGRISERWLTALGGGLFLLFGIVAALGERSV